MKLNLGFSVIANCVPLEPEEHDTQSLEFILHFDIETAMMFATKLGPNAIDLEIGEDYLPGRIIFSRKATDPDYLAILLVLKDNDTFIVKNPHQLLKDVLEGYTKLVALNKISSIIDFDFEAGLEFQE